MNQLNQWKQRSEGYCTAKKVEHRGEAFVEMDRGMDFRRKQRMQEKVTRISTTNDRFHFESSGCEKSDGLGRLESARKVDAACRLEWLIGRRETRTRGVGHHARLSPASCSKPEMQKDILAYDNNVMSEAGSRVTSRRASSRQCGTSIHEAPPS